MEPTDSREKLEFWREHVRKAALFEGTQGKYAEQNRISASKLSYYKGILNSKAVSGFTKVVSEVKTEAPVLPPKAAVNTVPSACVPDAVWLAIFMRELFK